MNNFRTDGLYIKTVDRNETGYLTQDKEGNYKKHTYGFLGKLSDVLKHGRTKEISYSYIYIQSVQDVVIFYYGSVVDELTHLLLQFEVSRRYIPPTEGALVSEDLIEYKDSKGRVGQLKSMSNGVFIFSSYLSVFDGSEKIDKHQFYPFP